jgi:hypothetical protein
MAIPEKKLPPQKLTYHDYHISLFPYAGGFKSFIFRPGETIALKDCPMLVGTDDQQEIIKDQIIRLSYAVIDQDRSRKRA